MEFEFKYKLQMNRLLKRNRAVYIFIHCILSEHKILNSSVSLVISISIILVVLSVTWAIMSNKRLGSSVENQAVCNHLDQSSFEQEISSERKTDFTGTMSAIDEDAELSSSNLTMSDSM